MEVRTSERPKARQYSVQELVEMAQRGELRVPEWQRLFKWKTNNIRELLDSLEKGFPIGTLLLWKRPEPAPAGTLQLGPHAFPVKQSADALWVIDGRQRLTTLAGVFWRRGSPDRDPGTRDMFTWAYDLSSGEWLNPGAKEAWKPEWLPADRLVDATDLVAWIASRADALTPEMKARASSLARDIREYEIPAVIVAAERDETLRVIFQRTNDAGVRLRANETFDALQGALTAERPSTIRELATVPVEMGFGKLDPDWLLKIVIQVAGGDFTNAHVTDNASAADIPRTADALRRALAFLMADVGIPNEALLPYRLPLAVLTAFFDKHPSPKPRSLDLLARWVWRGAASGEHQGENIPTVRSLFSAIDEQEEPSVQRLLALSSRSPPGFRSFARVNTRTAATRLELLALLSLMPRDLETGAELDGAGLIASHGSKALPAVVSNGNSGRGELAETMVNRVAQPPERRHVDDLLAQAPESWASTHGVDGRAQDYLRNGQLDRFLEARHARLSTLFREFFEARTRPDEPDRPSISSLIIEDAP